MVAPWVSGLVGVSPPPIGGGLYSSLLESSHLRKVRELCRTYPAPLYWEIASQLTARLLTMEVRYVKPDLETGTALGAREAGNLAKALTLESDFLSRSH